LVGLVLLRHSWRMHFLFLQVLVRDEPSLWPSLSPATRVCERGCRCLLESKRCLRNDSAGSLLTSYLLPY
jgi:hypothetical protein